MVVPTNLFHRVYSYFFINTISSSWIVSSWSGSQTPIIANKKALALSSDKKLGIHQARTYDACTPSSSVWLVYSVVYKISRLNDRNRLLLLLFVCLLICCIRGPQPPPTESPQPFYFAMRIFPCAVYHVHAVGRLACADDDVLQGMCYTLVYSVKATAYYPTTCDII